VRGEAQHPCRRRQALLIAAIGAAAVALVVAIVAVVLARRAIRAAAAPHSRTLRELLHAVSRGDIDRVPALLRQLDLHVGRLEDRLDGAERRLSSAIQKIGLSRFDADPDLGGKVSFSLALLDEHDDGVIVTSMYRLEESRTFLREVRGGTTEHGLLPEEARALNMAMDEDLQGRRQERSGSRRAAKRQDEEARGVERGDDGL